MKKLLLFLFIAILIISCQKKYPDILVEFNSRFNGYGNDAKFINVQATDLYYRFEKETDSNWCSVEKKGDKFRVLVKANRSNNVRYANILFSRINGKGYFTVTVKQSAFYWSEAEKQLLDAFDIVEKVYPNNVSIQLDTIDNWFESYNIAQLFTGTFSYTSASYSINQSIYITPNNSNDDNAYYSSDFHYVSICCGIFGKIYTGYNSDGHKKGDFNIEICTDGIYVELTQDGN